MYETLINDRSGMADQWGGVSVLEMKLRRRDHPYGKNEIRSLLYIIHKLTPDMRT